MTSHWVRIPYCDITMGSDVARGIHCDVRMGNDIESFFAICIITLNYDIAFFQSFSSIL